MTVDSSSPTFPTELETQPPLHRMCPTMVSGEEPKFTRLTLYPLPLAVTCMINVASCRASGAECVSECFDAEGKACFRNFPLPVRPASVQYWSMVVEEI